MRALSVLNVVVLCTIIFVSSLYSIEYSRYIGALLIILGFLCLASLRLFKIRVSSVGPDIVFGVIDNGILAVMAVFGGRLAGTVGAIIGGVVGNAITDGIAGMFEGYWAENEKTDHRTILGSAVGKMAGCLLGAGAVLAVTGFLGL
jgi:hypothetical protein